MSPDNQGVALLRDEVLGICAGTAFVMVGVAAWALAAARRRSGVRVFVWLGTWSAVYGIQELGRVPSAVAALPRTLQAAVPYVNVAAAYLVPVFAMLAWLELSRGSLRRLVKAITATGIAIAVAGIGTFLVTRDSAAFMPLNIVITVFFLLLLVTVVALPTRLARRYLVLPHKGVLLAGTLVFVIEALSANLSRSLGHPSPRIFGWLGFAALLFSFGYAALQAVLANERRLQSIEHELAVARRLQLSILPTAFPELGSVRIAAAYEPMTAVAGDFYEFIPVDRQHAGFLVADVSGHGVPAALIASMIKVAVQSVAAWAHDPAELLRRLGGALQGHLRGQYVTAAYLWLDTETRTARYSAAGHPPLIHWRAATGTVTRIESNGLLFGVAADSDYPACAIPFDLGDRFLLYTDGLTEPENATGEPFGDARLEQVLRECQAKPAEELARALLAAITAWRPASVAQQDDITFLIIDVFKPFERTPDRGSNLLPPAHSH
jgi:sigma-B regulation protein RsbU (phosphoserine phosphatase)